MDTTITYSILGDGSTKAFPLKWSYIHPSYVRVGVRLTKGAPVTPVKFTWLEPGRIEISPAPAVGAEVVISRETPSDAPLVSFYDGSTLTGTNLNTVSTQFLHIVQESRDYTQQVHDYVGKAEGYLEQLGGLSVAVDKAETAAKRADQVLGLSIAVTDAPHGHVASGSYNAKSGMLTLSVPKGAQGKSGDDGKDGKDGKDGAPGNNGVIMDVKTGKFALEIINGDLFLFYEDEKNPPKIYMDANGHLIWEQA